MNKRSLILVVLFCFLSAAFGQNRLAESVRHSNNVLVYTINGKNLQQFLYGRDLDYRSLLGDSVTQYRYDDVQPALPLGNYILVSSKEGELVLEAYTHDDFIYTVIPGKLLQLRITNSKGENIPDVEVSNGRRKAKYNSKLQLYYFNSYKATNKKIDKGVITFNHNGIYHYGRIVKEDEDQLRNYSPRVRKQSKIGKKRKVKKDRVVMMSGFMVTNKPKYKPNETVKIKLFATDDKGEFYNKPIDVMLQYEGLSGKGSYRTTKDTILLHSLEPYRPGMYQCEIKLSDSLNLLLDTKCTIKVKRGNERENWSRLNKSFAYEDYELKGIEMHLKSPKGEYYIGEDVTFTIKVNDENSMPVYGGKAEVAVLPSRLNGKASNVGIFMPDTLWFEQIDMRELSDIEITLPDSIFPRNASFDYRVECTYWSPDNEKKFNTLWQSWNRAPRALKIGFTKGVATINSYDGGEIDSVAAEVNYYGAQGRLLERREVMLPYKDTIGWNVHKLEAVDGYGYKVVKRIDSNQSPLQSSLTRVGDSILLQVKSITPIPFWYRLMRNDKLIESGYVTELNKRIVNKKRSTYQLAVDYIYGEGGVANLTNNLNIVNQNAYLTVETPQRVYPGQEVELLFSMSNRKGEPIVDADITAYGYTSKFHSCGMPSVPTFVEVKEASNVVNTPYDCLYKEKARYNREALIDSMWRAQLGLDSVEYYQFLLPDQFYHYSIPSEDSVTQIIPYVVKDGKLMNSYLLWIDNSLYHYANSEQQKVYCFNVAPGKHNLRFRINDRLVLLNNVPVRKGHRNYYSFNGALPEFIVADDSEYSNMKMFCGLLPEECIGVLSAKEQQGLAQDLLAITPMLGYKSLPGLFTPIHIADPMVLETYGNYYYINPMRHNGWKKDKNLESQSVLVGPFPERSRTKAFGSTAAIYSNNKLVNYLPIEGNSGFVIYQNTLVNKSDRFEKWFNKKMANYSVLSLYDKPLSRADIDYIYKSDFQKVVCQTYSEQPIYSTLNNDYKEKGKLTLTLLNDEQEKQLEPMLILFSPIGNGDSLALESSRLYYGKATHFYVLPYGEMELTLIMNDTLSYSRPIEIKQGGMNYLVIDSIAFETRNSKAMWGNQLFMDSIASNRHNNPYDRSNGYNMSALQKSDGIPFYGGQVVDKWGNPIIGAVVMKKGTSVGAICDFDGIFALDLFPNDVIEVSCLGYKKATAVFKLDQKMVITLMEETDFIEEVKVVGYGTRSKKSSVGSAVVSEASASSRLVNDEVIENEGVVEEELITEELVIEGGGNMRRNFHDDAFWQPAIRTDKEGKASVTVSYPDDITEWQTYYIGVGNNNKQIAKEELTIKSYLNLSARLSLPHFAVRGDSLEAIGRVVNYLENPMSLIQTIAVNGDSVREAIELKRSYINSIPVAASEGDSLTLSYDIRHEGGFYDGEERKIPIFEQGLMKSYGDFKILSTDKPYLFTVDPALGDVTLYAETSAIELFKRELNWVINYTYGCNEQMASKINALLMLKRLNALQGEVFKSEKDLQALIDRLVSNQNSEKLWGWWNQGTTESWISEYVINALLNARDAGYKIELNDEVLIYYLHRMVEVEIDMIRNKVNRKYVSKQKALSGMILLKRIDQLYPFPYQNSYEDLAAMMPDRGLEDRLKSQYALYKLGLFELMSKDSVVRDMQRSMLGNYFWAEKGRDEVMPLSRRPNISNVENSLLGYELLKMFEVGEDTISGIRNYFFESRSNNRWSNTYESMRIITTLMPDMLQDVAVMEETTLKVNDKEITTFPYIANLGEVDRVMVSKTGSLPLFVTVYQEAWVDSPKVEQSKGFTIESYFKSNKEDVAMLKAGRSATLEVEVSLIGEANYVMIEIPIPAGCSYEDKEIGRNRDEVHREYYKDRVVIFCNRLSEGKHFFSVNLLPRYNGRYHVNPANVELMYFPTIQGNNSVKQIDVAH